MSLTIVEVLGRAIQGRTRPYICRGDDDEVYFVKGHSVTRRGLLAEWLGARLAERFGLPVAPYAIAHVPEELVDADLEGLRDLGAGEVFASKRVMAVEFTREHLDMVPGEVRRDVLAFDWWVRNGDRSLTAAGGNPNLLWNPAAAGGLVVIDHNLAFDADFSESDYADLHVFSDDIRLMFGDFLVRQAYAARFAVALGIWEEACDNVPESWKFVDQERTISADIDFDGLRAILDRAFTENFWRLPI